MLQVLAAAASSSAAAPAVRAAALDFSRAVACSLPAMWDLWCGGVCRVDAGQAVASAVCVAALDFPPALWRAACLQCETRGKGHCVMRGVGMGGRAGRSGAGDWQPRAHCHILVSTTLLLHLHLATSKPLIATTTSA